MVQGFKRICLRGVTQTSPYMVAKVEEIEEIESGNREEQALSLNLSRQFQKMVEFVPALSNELQATALSFESSAGKRADFYCIGSRASLRREAAVDSGGIGTGPP